jgi:amidase
MLLGAMTGIDDADAVTKQSEGKAFTDYTRFLDPYSLKGKRIGIDKKPQGDNQFMHALKQKATDLLRQQGAQIIEIDYFERTGKLSDAEFELLKYEFRDGLNKYLTSSNSVMRSLADVIAFNRANENKAMPYFKQDIFESSEEKKDMAGKEYKEVFHKSHEGSKQILDEVINQHKLDAICGLTMGPACSIDMIYGDRWGDVFLTSPAAMSGYPHISVPCGRVYDLPVGLSFFGPAYSEPMLLSLAYAYEQASKNRIPPKFVKSFLS